MGVLALAPQKRKQRHRNETILQLRERGITNYETQVGVLALAPQKKYDGIATRHLFLRLHERGITSDSCWCYWDDTVFATHIERMSREAGKRRSFFACAVALLLSTWKQNEQRSETVFELVGKEKSGRHRAEKKRNKSQWKRANEPDANANNKHASVLNSLDWSSILNSLEG